MHTKEDPTDVLGRIGEVAIAGFPEEYEGIDGTSKAVSEAMLALEKLRVATTEDEKEELASNLIFAAGALARLAISIDPPAMDDE